MVSDKRKSPVWIIAGTRPEIIKLAPVFFRAREHLGKGAVQWISTGQHQSLEDDTLKGFGIEPDYRLAVRKADASLLDVNERTIRGLTELQRQIRPALAVVQGDTVSTFAAAFAAFHAGIPVAHVEAGLRSGDIHDPFPEEAYRRMTDALASIHFAPTGWAAGNLEAEGHRQGSVVVTGNTSIDALKMLDAMGTGSASVESLTGPSDGRLVFVTLHRREAWGRPLEEMCQAIRELVERFDDIHIVLPLHVNPRVRGTVEPILQGIPRIVLTPPLDFVACHSFIRRSYLILTDSGGIQEEAPSYGVPVLVLRKVTERPEAVREGFAILAGTDRREILDSASRILEDPELHARMRARQNPFGDGKASERIVLAIERFLSGHPHLLTINEQFRR